MISGHATPRRFAIAWPTAATLLVVLAAVLLRAIWFTNGDVSWLLDVAGRTLDGAVPYRDFLETNPPASIWIYMPAVWLARWVGGSPEVMTDVLAFVGTVLSLAFSGAILMRTRLIDPTQGRWMVLAAAFLLLIVPLNSFSQREHIVLLALLPMLAGVAGRIAGGAPSAREAVLAGLGAGIALSVKPLFGLALLGPLAMLFATRSWRAVLAMPELWIAGALVSAYGLAVVLLCPDYVARVLPLLVSIYVPARLPAMDLLGAMPVWVWVPLLVTFCWARPPQDVIGTVLATASVGFEAGFFLQGKGFFYHGYPAVALAALACAWTAIERPLRIGDRFAIRFAPAVIATLASLIVFAEYYRDDPAVPAMKRAIAAIASHPRVLTISDNMMFGRAFARDIGGDWVASTPLAWITLYAMAITPRAEADPRFADAIAMERDRYAGDIERGHPDVILIDGDGWMRWTRHSPALIRALSRYRSVGRYDAITLLAEAPAAAAPVGVAPTIVGDAEPKGLP